MTARVEELLQRGEAVGLPPWLLDRLGADRGGGASEGLIRAATRWITELEAAQAHQAELAQRLAAADHAPDDVPDPAPDHESGEDTRAVQQRIRRQLGLEAARGLAARDPGGALALLDDTEGPLPLHSARSRARQRMLEFAAREGSLGVIPALTPGELDALHGAHCPEDAMDVIIAAARRVRDLANKTRAKLQG